MSESVDVGRREGATAGVVAFPHCHSVAVAIVVRAIVRAVIFVVVVVWRSLPACPAAPVYVPPEKSH